jgi:hypothetical protein
MVGSDNGRDVHALTWQLCSVATHGMSEAVWRVEHVRAA